MLAFALALVCAAPGSARPSRHEFVLAPADSLAARGQPARAAAFADSVLRVAQERGDRALEAVVGSRRVLVWVGMGRLEEGEREAQRVAALARAERDTLSWARALLAEGRSHLFRDRLAAAARPYRRLLPLARAVRDPLLEGNARLGLAYLDLTDGRLPAAETGYRRAIALLERTAESRSEIAARIGLARVQSRLGRADDLRRSYQRILERCRATGDRVNEADAWNNLGALDAAAGEPARAAEKFARALRLSRTFGRVSSQEVRNLAILLVEAGRAAAAAETLQAELARRPNSAWRESYPLRTQLAVIRKLTGRVAEGEKLLREQWALRDSVALDPAADAGLHLADLLSDDGRIPEARALALEFDRWLGTRRGAESEIPWQLMLASLALDAGEPAEALERLRALDRAHSAKLLASWRERISLAMTYSRAFMALGRPDSAVAAIRRAGEIWEAKVSGLRDAEWFEPAGNGASRLAVLTARALLDPRRPLPEQARAREAFDAVQRFKSRALDWRAGGPAARRAPLVTAAELQRRVLGPGEVFVDAYSSQADSTIVFFVTREAVRVHRTVSLDRAASELVRPLNVLLSPDEATAAFRPAAARRLAALAFGPHLDLLRRSRRVVTCLSGLLNAVPVAALPADTLGGALLGDGRTLAAVPSATWFARARRAASAVRDSARVVAVGRTTDDRGQVLAGVRDETRWLAARYRGGGLVHAGDRELAEVLPWIGRGDILHVSSHARASTQDVWGSAFLLGRGDEEDAWLSARMLAGRHPPARLAVLASCRSTLDRGFGNESVLGLARAFLAAGVPTVVSTMWPVDDRVTAAFTRRFYAGLEQGRTAADALRQAQAETRRVPATSAPYYWAGFTVSGDPDTRARPRRR